MLNKLCAFIRRYEMLRAGDRVVCALSGGADSVALTFALYLLKDKLGIHLAAAHFNHGLRAEESDRDEAFVRDFCARFDIALYVGRGEIKAGKKGLEAAARDARYAFFETLPGKIATAHTADDNAETLLMHLIRGTGLKGLGGITPARGNLIRPMLDITRTDVVAFLEEYHLPYIQDSSNDTDDFLRNRLRHHVMPLLKVENPKLAQNWSELALRLRQDEEALRQAPLSDVVQLKALPPALRSRSITAFLEENGVLEPDARHVALTEKLVFSQNPSAKANLPGGVTIVRRYDRLERLENTGAFAAVALNCPGQTHIPELGIMVSITEDPAGVAVFGTPVLRPRKQGDTITLPGGTKTLKKLFIDRKIPASQRERIPIVADDMGVLYVYGIGVNCHRVTGGKTCVRIEIIPEKE